MPGRAGAYAPAPPRTRTSPIKAYGSSSDATLNRGRGAGITGTSRRVSEYPACLLPTPHHQDSSLPYSQAPAVSVRLLSGGTMELLRRPRAHPALCLSGIAPRALGLTPHLRSPGGEVRHPGARVLFTGPTPLRSLVPRTRGPPKFPANPSCICPALRPRSGLHARRLRRFGVVPAQPDGEDPGETLISWLNHTAFALAVYASCRPHGRLRKTRFRRFARPFRVSLSMPTEFARRVSVSASPLPGLVLALLAPHLNLNPNPNLGDRRLGLDSTARKL